MTRRHLFAAGAALAATSRLWAKAGIDKSRISAITDEIGLSTLESIAFAHYYGLQNVEIRNPADRGRKEYFLLPEAEIKTDADLFAREGLKVSFVNTSLLKFTWPGTEPARKRNETPEGREKRVAAEQARWDRRMDDIQLAVRCAHIMGCDKVRVFSGTRVAEPSSMYQRIADMLGEVSKIGEREGVYFLLENEGSQNVASSRELADVMKLAPSKWVGFNWDPNNAHNLETAYPDGYSVLPKDRMLNLQIKGRGVMPPNPQEDWRAIFNALNNDNYRYKIGLETHLFDGTLITAAHRSMDEILKIAASLS
ncbi:MAG: TIM barrel protein [Acidobacteriota bacterium]|nr:TIM barrel protein [Acidobacteriota bacterium]